MTSNNISEFARQGEPEGSRRIMTRPLRAADLSYVRQSVTRAVNYASIDADCDTPDFILADIAVDAIIAYHSAKRELERLNNGRNATSR